MTDVLGQWNRLPAEEAAQAILPCCGSAAWARGMARRRPLNDEASLIAASNETSGALAVSDWMEAFASHPRIGDRREALSLDGRSAMWSAQEQKNAAAADDHVKQELADANREYERRFGRIFIVCATGRTAAEILEILRRRLLNDDATELRDGAEEQRKITELRLRKWLEG
jgi:2-oxo-4-hydroxy-4-carboxy-5-ureidoimidazoline decarboxylase